MTDMARLDETAASPILVHPMFIRDRDLLFSGLRYRAESFKNPSPTGKYFCFKKHDMKETKNGCKPRPFDFDDIYKNWIV